MNEAASYFDAGYFEWQAERAAQSARAVVPRLLELVQAQSVVDLGSGTGAWLQVFREHGVDDVVGIDGEYIDRSQLRIPSERFVGAELSEPPELGRTFDLALSLEAAHYAPEASAPAIVHALASYAPVVYFSAAVPQQTGGPGQNGQWPEYWSELFAREGLECYDLLRRELWERPDVDWWYAQNGLLFARPGALPRAAPTGRPLSLVHPELLAHVAEPAAAPARARVLKGITAATSLSVCCLTGGRNPERTAAILSLYREVADELVVAVDDRSADAAEQLAVAADRVVTYPFSEPGDRPIAWLFSLCRGPWLLNVDDDEVPSADLLAALPELCRRRDLTHGWIARRWLYPDVATYLDEPPWGHEFQLRLLRLDSPFVRFSDEFHRPVVAEGPAVFVEEPLWHLDTATSSFESRRAKALDYERARRGMRIDSFSHNSGLYLPELRPDVRTAAVPAVELAVIRSVLEAEGAPAGRAGTTVEHAAQDDIDGGWPGEPWPEALYDGQVVLLEEPRYLVSGVPQAVDVRVQNRGGRTWPWGREGSPQIRLCSRWLADGQAVDGEGLRTPLPHDVPSGESALVPVDVLPPSRPGRYTLEIDLVHEHVRWFGRPARLEVEVLPRRRVAVAGDGAALDAVLDVLVELPEVEPVLLRPGAPSPERFGHEELAGLRPLLVGVERPLGFATILGRTLAVLARPRTFVRSLAGCEAVVVAGPDWEPGAPVSRELWRVAVTLAAARSLGARLLLAGRLAPETSSAVDRALAAVTRRLAQEVAPERLVETLRSGTETATRRPA